MWLVASALEPRARAVLAIGIPEALLKNMRFTPGAEHLQDHQRDQGKQEPGKIQIQNQARNDRHTENIDGIANAGVEAVGDKGCGLRRNRERVAQLYARKREQR